MARVKVRLCCAYCVVQCIAQMFLVITLAYLIFWGPLFLVTLFNWSWDWNDAKKSMAHEGGSLRNLSFHLFSL